MVAQKSEMSEKPAIAVVAGIFLGRKSGKSAISVSASICMGSIIVPASAT